MFTILHNVPYGSMCRYILSDFLKYACLLWDCGWVQGFKNSCPIVSHTQKCISVQPNHWPGKVRETLKAIAECYALVRVQYCRIRFLGGKMYCNTFLCLLELKIYPKKSHPLYDMYEYVSRRYKLLHVYRLCLKYCKHRIVYRTSYRLVFLTQPT